MIKGEILVICELDKYDNEHTLQIITKAKLLARACGKEVAMFCAGEYHIKQLDEVIRYGVDHVLIYETKEKLSTRNFSDAVEKVIKSRNPEVVLFPASDYGKCVAASLSTRFEAGLTADCIDIEVTNEGEFYFSRAAINDSIIAKIKCINCNIKMCTVKKDVFVKKKYADDYAGKVEILSFNIAPNEAFLEILDRTKGEVKKEFELSQYAIVFCIGRGVKESSLRDRIINLAEKCNAGIIGTRAVVEENLIPKERQVGQSGKSISPKIYVGFGVSGASQHMVGIKNAGTIIAVNNDENAAIFNYADYSIVENIEDVVHEMELLLYIKDRSTL